MPYQVTHYADVMTEVQRALTLAEIAEATGVKARQVSNWAAGIHLPRGDARDQLLRLHYLLRRLNAVLEPEGVDIWLHGPNRNLDWKAPIELLAEGRFEPVSQELKRLEEAVV